MSANMLKCLPARIAAIAIMAIALSLTAASVASAGWTGVVHDVRQPDGNSSVFDIDVGATANGSAFFAWDGYSVNPSSHNYIDGAAFDGQTETVGQVDHISIPGQNALHAQVLGAGNGLASVLWRNNVTGAWQHTAVDQNGSLAPSQTASATGAGELASLIDAAGNVTYVWHDAESSPQAIRFQRIPAGSAPGPVTTVYEAEVGDQLSEVEVDVSSSGVTTVVWSRYAVEANSTMIYTARVQPDNTVGTPLLVHSVFSGYVSLQRVSVAPNGQAAIAYYEEDEDENYPYRLALIGTDDSITHAALPTNGLEMDSIFMDYLPTGVLMFGYASSLDDNQVRMVTVSSDATVSESVGLSPAGLYSYYDSQIVVDANGIATVVYSLSGQPSAVFATRSSDGINWSTPVQLSEDVDSYAAMLDVDPQGNVTVAWRTNDNTVQATQWRVGVNDAPVCEDGTGESAGGGISVFSLDCNSEAPMTYELVAPPENGTVTVDPDTGAVTYTPRAGFNGTDTFTFRATNSSGESEIRTFTVTVSDNPAAETPAPSPETPAALKLTDLKISQKLVPRRSADREKLRISFNLTRAADVRVVVMRRYGRKIGTACRSTRRVKKSGRLNRCLRDKPSFELKLGALSPGTKSVSISTKAVRELLNPGAYMLRVSAVADDGARAAGNRKFHVHWKSYE